MNDIEKIKQYFAGREVELPFIRPVYDYFVDDGNYVTITCHEDVPSIEVIDRAENKTGTREWVIVMGYPKRRGASAEWLLRYVGQYPRKEAK